MTIYHSELEPGESFVLVRWHRATTILHDAAMIEDSVIVFYICSTTGWIKDVLVASHPGFLLLCHACIHV